MKRISQILLLLFSNIVLLGVSLAANTVPLSQQPLLTSTQQPPNILFMIDDSGSMNDTVPNSGGMSRLEVAQQTVIDLLNDLTSVRVGLATFSEQGNSGNDGARLLVGIDDIDNNRLDMIDEINDLKADGGTPLANTELELGRYFVQNYNNRLTLHPGQRDESTAPAYSLFNSQPQYSNQVSRSSPIQYFCQKSFIVLLTDGEPSNQGAKKGDSKDPNSPLTDYMTIPCPVQPSGSNYSLTCALRNIANAMYDIDLRPDLTDPQGNPKKNNVVTYTIGLGSDLSEEAKLLLASTAENAGGVFLEADNAEDLVQVFQAITSSILYQSVSASGVGFSTQALDTDTAVYQSQYATSKPQNVTTTPPYSSMTWSGSLFKYPISQNGTVGAKEWDAGTLLTSVPYSNRLVFTYNNDSLRDTPVLFKTLSQLSAIQQSDLSTSSTGRVDGNGQLRLDFLLGDRRNERTASNPNNLFRQRESVLGDIVNSAPVYVGVAQSNWPDIAPFPTTSGQTYSSFKSGIAATRTPMVYVGANDGMLHGFNAASGQEVVAYVPLSLSHDFDTALQASQGINLSSSAKITLGLHYYSDPNYAHRFYVDGTPAIQDAYIKTHTSGSPAWRTVLIGGERAGGKGYYALDATDPANFSTANFGNTFLWEFSNKDNLDLGNTYSDPQIALMNNGRWAAIFGNGYNATGTNNATLFIVFLDGGLDGVWTKGTDYIEIDTRSGVATQYNTPNGLATPAAVDVDGNGTIDRIYAGDLNGDLWAFNVSSSTTANWGSAYGSSANPSPLYSGIATRPITTQPVVALNPAVSSTASNSPNLLVMVGTGKYLGSPDQGDTATQAFYAIWDAGVSNISQNRLVQQTFSTSGNNRIMSQKSVAYSTSSSGRKGWYILFPGGERVVFPASIFQVRINSNEFESEVAFSTFTPNSSSPCSYGGSGYFMVVQMATGGQPSSAILDTNNDNQVTPSDNISGQVVSGIQFSSAVPSQPVIRGDYLFIPSSNGTLQKILIATTGLPTGRLSWAILKQT